MAKGTIYVRVEDESGNNVADHFDVVLDYTEIEPEPIDPPITPVDPPPTGAMIPRPKGLDYIVPGFDPPEIPHDALRWSNLDADTLQEAINEARDLDVALHLDQPHEFVGDFRSLKLPQGLYGSPGVIIHNTGNIDSATPCGFYLVDGDCEVTDIEFQDFGTVFGMSTRSQSQNRGYPEPWDIHGSRRSAYGTGRCIDANSDFSGSKSGVPLDYTVYPETLDTIGPDLWISNCTFRDCENVYLAWSDGIGIGTFNFHRNKLIGTYGGFSLEGSWWTECYAVNNQWFDCTAQTGREIPSGLKASRFSTVANLGTNATIDVDVTDQIVQIFNNEARDIHATVNSDGTNAGVFMDARQVTPTEITNADDEFTWSCTCECSFNKIVGILGIRGQEDSNALYGKTRSMLIEGNYIERCGSYYYSEGSGDGAEATGTEFKQTGNMENSPLNAALVFRGNEFVDMPPKDKNVKMQAVQGTNDIGIPLWIIGNKYVRCHITQTSGNVPAVVRHYGNTPELKIMCNVFEDCNVITPAALIGFHALEGNPGPNSEISNNIAYGDYSGSKQLIYSSSGMSGAKLGLNSLVDNESNTIYAMTANFGSPTDVPERKYTYPTVPNPNPATA